MSCDPPPVSYIQVYAVKCCVSVCMAVNVHTVCRGLVFVCAVCCDHVSQCLADLSVCTCVCGPAACLLYFHVSHWLIGALVIAIATMHWHMPASWLPDWQHHSRGEIQRMLEQITPLPLPSSEWQSACRSPFPLALLPCSALVEEKQARLLCKF